MRPSSAALLAAQHEAGVQAMRRKRSTIGQKQSKLGVPYLHCFCHSLLVAECLDVKGSVSCIQAH